MIPFKGFVSQQPDSLISEVVFQLQDARDALVQKIAFRVMVEDKKQAAFSLYTSNDQVVLYSISEPAGLPLHLVHNRARRQKITLEVASLPEGIDRTGFPLSLELAPRQDTVFSLSVLPARYWSTSMPYQVTVTVRDESGSVLGNVLYTIVVATSAKRFSGTDLYQKEGYGVSAAVTKLSNNQWAREGRIWGSDSVGKAQVDFQLHYLDYAADHFQQLQNSYLSVRTARTKLHLGSLQDYHELPLLGRGLKVNLLRPDHQWTFWAVNSNPNWLNPLADAMSGNVLSVRYDHGFPLMLGSSWSFSSNYFTNSATQRAGFLNFGSVQFYRANRHSLEIMGGHSVEYARQGAERAQTMGWAGQLNYTFQKSNFLWNLRSYFSSPVYAGLQKGASIVQGQATWKASEGTALTARFNHVYYKQVLFTSPVERSQRVFGNTVAEVSLNRRWSSFALGLRPFWHAQADFTNPYAQQAVAYRFSPTVSYRQGMSQYLELSYDVGRLHNRSAATPGRGLLSQRILSSWVMRPFSLWAYWQKGPYFLNDLRADQSARYQTASVMPMVDFALLNRRLVGSVGVNYLYDSQTSGARCLAVGRVRYDITPDLWLKAEGNATPYSQVPDLAYSQYRLELTKRFSHLRFNRRGELRLSFFEDENGNGSRDSGERWADSLLVTINDNTLLTNSKGTLVYRNLPPGTYTVSAVSLGRIGEPVQYTEKITVGRAVSRTIPLTRSFRVKGQLQCQANAYDRQPCQYSRFTVDIQRGDKTVFSHSPQPDGGFAFHLPPGTYTLLLHDYARQPQTVIQKVPFTLTTAGQYPEFQLPVDGSTRAVEVKRFGSRASK
ncbi:hypothetical protein ACFQ4C_17755 [Larkinella insperata]|uniref:SD-repeat containing protein B domain-containing protein n=1 Tax=Larkinella insperata TaxID=332158 RepID=A0ABW3QBG2_9BACT|nr:hypothetical protein [Larkinella insperata]